MTLVHTTFVECSCGTEGISVSRWDGDPEVSLSLWSRDYYSGSRLGWRQRLRFAWQALSTGEPYLDQIVLTDDDARRLADALRGGVP